MNGSGKTTLLKVLTGQETISRGYVFYKENDEDLILNASDSLLGRQRLAPIGSLSMGYCAQENNLPPTLKLYEIIELFSALKHSSDSNQKKQAQYL